MGENSSIEWTDHTFNPWWGCSKVSPACDHCYAELWAKRTGHQLWGKKSARRFFGDSHWNEPLAWNQQAAAARQRKRVFCASMADVFERRSEIELHRARLWKLIEQTSNLDWLLLTKRPQNVAGMVPWRTRWPANVWLGTTIENQSFADKRLPFLLENPATIRFISCEPLLGALDLTSWFRKEGFHPIDWVIAGGESGPSSRPTHPDWASSILRQCQDAKVPFHFKQWGRWVPAEIAEGHTPAKLLDFDQECSVKMVPLRKKVAGRILQGSTWDGLPLTHSHG